MSCTRCSPEGLGRDGEGVRFHDDFYLCSGQTGSGKTFTMIGPNDESDVFTHDLRGIIPRSFEYLFNLITREQLKASLSSLLLVPCVQDADFVLDLCSVGNW